MSLLRCLKIYTLGGRRGGVGVLAGGGRKFSLSSGMRVFGECLLGNGVEKSVGVDKELLGGEVLVSREGPEEVCAGEIGSKVRFKEVV